MDSRWLSNAYLVADEHGGTAVFVDSGASGFLPREVSSLLSGEPELTDVLGLLQNNQVPEAYRESMRQVLRLIAEQARLVLKDVEIVAA